jgi:hypothetical protein
MSALEKSGHSILSYGIMSAEHPLCAQKWTFLSNNSAAWEKVVSGAPIAPGEET